ncbi:MAG TPA: GTPase domain-containing protein [Micromonosporaceae bacterium]
MGEALRRLRGALATTTYPLAVPSAAEARRTTRALITQLDDYLLPRLARLDAPLLVVVGGSTGAGKSTLVNSLVRARVTVPGVLRPTTRAPVLVCHPRDLAWFRQAELLPGLTRTTRPSDDPRTLQLVSAPALTPGLAFLDAPDIDSVVDANRALSAQLLAAADLWLFVTTATRYADAVPWELLRTAQLRGTVITVVLNRVPGPAGEEIAAHLSEMLAAQDLAAAPLFVVPETEVDGQGLLPEAATTHLRAWFDRLAADPDVRAGVVRQTLDGALAALHPTVTGLAAAIDEQTDTALILTDVVEAAYRTARQTLTQGLRDGRLLRGEVLARWQEFTGSGEMLRQVQARIGRRRDRRSKAATGRPGAAGEQLQTALESQLATLLRAAAAEAAETAYAGWQREPAGAALLDPELKEPGPELSERAERLIRDWQRGVLELVAAEGGGRRRAARGAAYAVNATGLTVMVAVFASTAFIPTGLEVAAGAGTAVAGQKLLEAIFGDRAIRALAAKARDDLLARIDALFAEEADRYLARLRAVEVRVGLGTALRRAAAAVENGRRAAALTARTGLALPGADR